MSDANTPEQKEHSFSYDKLTEEQKIKADTILGYLNNENTQSAKKILSALEDEISYHSNIHFN